MNMQTIWFIRHGESEANEGKPTSDPTTVRLTDKGCEQAEWVAQAFEQPPSLIVASSYIRTGQTAWATWERFPNTHYEEMPVHEFTYLPSCESKKTTNGQRKPLVDAYWQRYDPYYVDENGEGGESFEGFMKRVYTIVENLQSRPEEFIAVFSHEQFIWAVFWLLLCKPTAMNTNAMKQFRYLLTMYPIPNGAILQVQFDQGKTWAKGIIPSHLEDTFETRFSIYTLLHEGIAEDEPAGVESKAMATPLVRL
jgi:broad specificity phosphatase PhoE